MKSKINVGELLVKSDISLEDQRLRVFEPFEDNPIPIKDSPFLLDDVSSDVSLHNVRVNLMIGQYNISDVDVNIDRVNFTPEHYDLSRYGVWSNINTELFLEYMLHEALFAYHEFIKRNELTCRYNMLVTAQYVKDYSPSLTIVNDDYVITFYHASVKD